ncbi:hypothetical protein CF161_03738 [Pseudomonas sp. CF161]|nr:hypothetical protein CF161_03738 [Pseudomonas sp. CF161]
MTGACLTVSQMQSIPWAAAPSSASLLLVTSVFVTPIVTRGECRKALYELGCSSGRSARLFPGERDGRRLAQGNGQADRLLQGSYEREEVAAVGTLVKVGIHHIAVTVRAAGR